MCLQYINLEAKRKTSEDNHNKINQQNIIIVQTLSDVKTKWIFDCLYISSVWIQLWILNNLGTTIQNPWQLQYSLTFKHYRQWMCMVFPQTLNQKHDLLWKPWHQEQQSPTKTEFRISSPTPKFVTVANHPLGSNAVTENKKQRTHEKEQERREEQERDMCHLVGRKLHMAQTCDAFFLLYFRFEF